MFFFPQLSLSFPPGRLLFGINEIVALRGKLPQAVVGKRFGIEQTDVSQIQRQQKGKLMRADDKPRARDVEVVLPIVFGSCAFWLGKKADDFSNPSLIVERPPFMLSESGWGEFEIHTFPLFPHVVVFQLHPSFSNPTRIVERPPFMLSESGWGEFEIAMTIVFHADASEMPAEL
ncbi:unnamed protein product [Closterium sp. NIES-64]|nr:unnamed protein product [Closterium sp. NIES-64]